MKTNKEEGNIQMSLDSIDDVFRLLFPEETPVSKLKIIQRSDSEENRESNEKTEISPAPIEQENEENSGLIDLSPRQWRIL